MKWVDRGSLLSQQSCSRCRRKATSPVGESLEAEEKGAGGEVLCHLEVDGLGGQADKQCHVRFFERQLVGVASLSGEGTCKIHSYALKRLKGLSFDWRKLSH